MRPLFSPLCPDGEVQGALAMWVDVLTKDEAGQYPAIDIALPPKLGFELRLTVWRCQQLPASTVLWGSKGRASDCSDYYVKVSASI